MPIQLKDHNDTYVIDIDKLSKNISMLREIEIEICDLKEKLLLKKKIFSKLSK